MKMTQELFVEPETFGCLIARVIAIPVESGAKAKAGQPLIEFECEKASFEVSMPADGIVHRLHLSLGDSIESRTLVATITIDDTDRIGLTNSRDENALVQLLCDYPMIAPQESFSGAVSELDRRLLIRPTDNADIPMIAEIWRSSFAAALRDQSLRHKEDQLHEAWFSEQLLVRNKHFLTAVLDDNDSETMIGFGNLETVQRTPITRFGIVGIHVSHPTASWTPSHRLFESLVAIAKQSSLPQLHAYIVPTNQPAARLLKSLGFVEAGLLRGGKCTNDDRALFILNLCSCSPHHASN